MFRWCIGWSSQNFILLIFAPAFRMLQTVILKSFRTHRTVTVLHQFLDSLAFPFQQSLYHLHTFFLYIPLQVFSNCFSFALLCGWHIFLFVWIPLDCRVCFVDCCICTAIPISNEWIIPNIIHLYRSLIHFQNAIWFHFLRSKSKKLVE